MRLTETFPLLASLALASLAARVARHTLRSPQILILLLQLFSNHPSNYTLIEPAHNILSLFLTSYPYFKDDSLKMLVLKTLEFVCTGIGDSNPTPSLVVGVELFVAMCQSVLDEAGSGSDSDDDSDEEDSSPRLQAPTPTPFTIPTLTSSINSVTNTLLKLLEFDSNFSTVLISHGFLRLHIYQLLNRITLAITGGISHSILNNITLPTLKILRALLKQPTATSTFFDLFSPTLLSQIVKFLDTEPATVALTCLEEVSVVISRSLTTNSASSGQLDAIISTLIELLHSLMQSKNQGQERRQHLVYEALNAAIGSCGDIGRDIYIRNSGFEAGMCTLARLSSSFSTTATATTAASQASETFLILSSVLTLFSTTISYASVDSNNDR